MKQVKLPENSVLQKDNSFQFIDAYQSDFLDENNTTDIVKICKLFFSSDPKWIEKLFSIRNKIVKSFGLKVSENILNRKQLIENFKCEVNEQIGLFKVFQKTENEVILGEDDKHLDFRVSLLLENENANNNRKQLTISTCVKFNNQFGKLYFIPVKPFHRMIVPTMLKGIMNQIERLQVVTNN